MKKSILATAVLAAFGLGSAANAAITITVTDLGVPTDGGSKGPLVGYHAYLVTADAGSGNIISAVDFSREGVAGKSISTPVHQLWLNSVVGANSIPASTSATNGTSILSYDSHLILVAANVGYGSAPFETNDAYNTTTQSTQLGTSPFGPLYNGNAAVDSGNDIFGNGTLAAAYGVTNAADQTQVRQLAYLVVPDSVHLTSNFTIATPQIATGGAQSGGQFAPVVLPALLPEPTSMALLGMASAGLLARRRRNA